MNNCRMNNFHFYLCSSDSLENFPLNRGNSFRVRLSEAIDFSNGEWDIVLTSLTIVLNESESAAVLPGLVLDVYCNIVGLSVVGGKKRQLLRRVNIGQPTFNSPTRVVFEITSVENYCFYKPVLSQNCAVIEIELRHPYLYINHLLENCTAYVSLHLKRNV